MSSTPGPHNLTGIWHGLYSYPDGRPTVSFVATLIESGATVSGTTHESCGDTPDQTLFATLLGQRHDRNVAFLKTYDGANPHYTRVAYDGTLSADGTEIEGRWLISGDSTGKFLMIRSAGREAAVRREAFERA